MQPVWKTVLSYHEKVKKVLVVQSCLDSLQLHELWPARLHDPWNYPGKNTGVGSHFLLQGIFPNQGSNISLLHCRQILYQLRHLGIWAFTKRIVPPLASESSVLLALHQNVFNHFYLGYFGGRRIKTSRDVHVLRTSAGTHKPLL